MIFHKYTIKELPSKKPCIFKPDKVKFLCNLLSCIGKTATCERSSNLRSTYTHRVQVLETSIPQEGTGGASKVLEGPPVANLEGLKKQSLIPLETCPHWGPYGYRP